VDVALLASLPEPERSRVLDACQTCTFTKGETLFSEGDLGDSLHVVETGRLAVEVRTETGDVVMLDVVGPGGVVGEVALVLPGSHRTATVIALDAVTTRMLTSEAFDALCENHPSVRIAASQLLAERVERLTKHLVEALYVSVDRRVARRIWTLAAMHGGPVRGTELPLTQQDIADLAGATRPTVNQSLKKLEAQGAVTLFRGGVRIADEALLRRRAALPALRAEDPPV
jgi:CRP/FNR family transcriptional regulator, cyclic AMP receptor protein